MRRKYLLASLTVAVVLIPATLVSAAQKTLDIYFIDTEGGAATLIVTPAGHSLLIDTGFPGDRDSGRIAHVALDLAKLKQIDHCVVTHWHRDHEGGVPTLAKLIPIKNYYDHGLPPTIAADMQAEFVEAYKQTVQGKSVTLKPGDEIKLETSVKVRVLAAGGMVLGDQSAAPQIRPCGDGFVSQPEDKSDNAASVAILLTFGAFRFFNGGDLTWNVENRLVCPKNLIGKVDVYQVDHHGTDSSNNPKMVQIIEPQVAVIENGAHKGGEARTFATLKNSQVEAIYQLHRNVQTTEKDNAPPDFVANDEENCKGEMIKVSVASDGKSYSVSIPAKNISRTYLVR
jgi:beta-lactamase superfamily II metal-dependent hydrolase